MQISRPSAPNADIFTQVKSSCGLGSVFAIYEQKLNRRDIARYQANLPAAYCEARRYVRRENNAHGKL